MKNPEFSDMFTTLLNSYNTQANFGEEASKRDIVLDEYEKSVLLTQAQDIIVKSYFDRTHNSQAQGFDDSTRRQVDFSSLIKVTELDPYGDNSNAFDPRGIIYKMPLKKVRKLNPDYDPNDDESQQYIYEDSNTTDVLFILNEKLIARTIVESGMKKDWYYDATSSTPVLSRLEVVDDEQYSGQANKVPFTTVKAKYGGSKNIKTGDYVFQAKVDVDPVYDNNGFGKEYVIVPINYKEYDREMSKPFAQPLKKQAWRLFQNLETGFDVHSELIPKWSLRVSGYSTGETVLEEGDIELKYKIRYVKRPCPIILEQLPNELSIDGESDYSECELNPILHMDILNKAVELAITTRGGAAAERGQFPANNMRGNNN